MSKVDDIRAGLEADLADAGRDEIRDMENLAATRRRRAVCQASLDAHDRAVEAMRAAQPTLPGVPAEGSERASRRNIIDEVFGRLTGIPQTPDALAAVIGNVRETQIINALLKLGERAVMEGNGYVRRDLQEPL